MMLFVLLFLLFFGVIYLLFIPIIIYINTKENLYYLALKGLFKASLEKHPKEIIQIKFQLFFYHFYYYPFKKARAPIFNKKIGNFNIKSSKWAKNLIKSFKIKELQLNIDTGDFILNAKLFPLIAILNTTYGDYTINFKGKNYLVFKVQSRPAYIITSFINN